MSQDSDEEKTESPTPHRLEKAREEGQVPRSRELTAMLMLLVGLCILWWGGAWMARQLAAMIAAGLHFDHAVIRDTGLMLRQISALLGLAVWSLIPVMTGLVVVAIASPLLLGGLVLSGKSLKVDIGKINPLKGLKRMVSGQAAAELVKALLKALLVGAVAGAYLWHNWPHMAQLIGQSPLTALHNALNMVAVCGLVVLLGLIPMVGFDIFWQLYSYFKNLRMTRQEIRDEFKEQEGDPHVKGRIRQQMQAAARRRMMQDVPKADVIVTNPTHYAVALRYDEKKMSAPTVLAKGAGEVALRIRELGATHRIPLLEAPPLARALYRHSDIGQQIPGQLYAAVAEVLAWVWQVRRWKREGGLIPSKPEHLPVPEALDFAVETPDHE
ncbi:flagellar biosynthesis protein FlhB [Pantoea sp. 1.19]|uniref:flagellar biosynthesis protein FlhB n=1 Tax=Pantoea sp. 1.19 TaxID=1925589 RepID=UPI000948D99C|nr:flagellar biosynthesis protein FlhB [Pantoea sp. 1.19]